MRFTVLSLVMGLCFAVGGAQLVMLYSRTPRAEQHPIPMSPELRRRMLELEHEAIEDAFKRQVRHLFLSWMKDDTGQPERAAHGVEKAQRAFIHSMQGLERKKNESQVPMPRERP